MEMPPILCTIFDYAAPHLTTAIPKCLAAIQYCVFWACLLFPFVMEQPSPPLAHPIRLFPPCFQKTSSALQLYYTLPKYC